MPTPGGLPRAGDYIINADDPERLVYKVLERTSASAPFSIWIKRVDGKKIVTGFGNFRPENTRSKQMEVRLSCETGFLPGRWRNYHQGVDAIQPEPRVVAQIVAPPGLPPGKYEGVMEDGKLVVHSSPQDKPKAAWLGAENLRVICISCVQIVGRPSDHRPSCQLYVARNAKADLHYKVGT